MTETWLRFLFSREKHIDFDQKCPFCSTNRKKKRVSRILPILSARARSHAPKSNTESFSLTGARPLPVLPRFQEGDRQQFTHLAGIVPFSLVRWCRTTIVKPADAFCAESRLETPNWTEPRKTRNSKKETAAPKETPRGYPPNQHRDTSRVTSTALVCEFAEWKLTIDTAFHSDIYHYYIERKKKKEKKRKTAKLIRLRREDVGRAASE